MRKLTLLIVVSALLSGCAQKSEEERLAKRMSKWRYRGYRAASEKATGTVIEKYKQRTGEDIDAATVHAALSVLWFTQQRYEFCYLEADILAEQQHEDAPNMSLAMQTLALYGMEFPRLSKARYDELKTLLAAASEKTPEEIQVEHKLFLAALIIVSLYHGDPNLAKFGADALGATSQLDYLGPLVGVIAEAKKGHLGEARKELAELSKSDQFQEHARAMIKELSDLAEKAEDPEEFLADALDRMPRVLVRRLMDDIFAEEKMAGLWEEVRWVPELIVGAEDTQQASPATNSCLDAMPRLPQPLGNAAFH